MELVVATRNKHKLKEIKTLLKGLPVNVFSLDFFKGVPEVIEDGKTLEENARKKAVQISRFLKRLVLADDSGLEVDYLRGQPGVYSARFSGKGATYKSNNEKLLGLLKGLTLTKRRACFRCVIAIANKGRMVGIAEGRRKGRIIFRSLAEMSPSQKNKISHRAKALAGARKIILGYL
jgi:XTP/dITP diphosphohydrolase